MEQVRFNPFHQIHQGLRAMLYHCSLAVQQTDFTNAEQAGQTLDKVAELVALFEGHAHTEDTMVFPLLLEHAPEVVQDFESQHEEDHALGLELERCVTACRQADGAVAKIIAGQELQRALAGFTAFNLNHMNQEETIIKSLAWKHYTDEELLAQNMKIVANIPPEKNARYSYWMLKGLAMKDIIHWYRQIRATAPAFVVEGFMQLAARALSPQKHEQLLGALEVNALG